MNDVAFEEALRASLIAAAPLEVPARLEHRARAISMLERPRRPWWRQSAPRTKIGVAAMIAALVLTVAVALVIQRANMGTAGGGPPNPVRIQSEFGSVVASDLNLTVGGRIFHVPSSAAQPGVSTLTLGGSPTYGRLTIVWHAGSNPLTLVMHFAADAHSWWVSEIVANDGRPDQAGWLYFEGPLFERPLGSAFTGSIELSSARSTYGENGSLGFGELSLSAFAGGSPRNPTLGTMPPQDGASAAAGPPDFIPMVGGGSQIVGYVPTAELDQPVPIASLRGQSPDQPVYGSDLKTLVGYAVPGSGFEPLSSPTTQQPPPPGTSDGTSILPGPVISWDHPFQSEGVTVDAGALVATPGAFGLGFIPARPALTGGRFRWVDVSRSGTVAFMFDFSGDPRFGNDARVQVEQSRASISEAEFLSIKWVGEYSLTPIGTTTILLQSSNGIGDARFIRGGILYEILGPALGPTPALDLATQLVQQLEK